MPSFSLPRIAAGNPEGGARTIFEQTALAGTHARGFPTETPCEEAFVRLAAGRTLRRGKPGQPDAVVQGKLLGAGTLTIVNRMGRDRMSASACEQGLARSKGVRIITNARPVAEHGTGAVRGAPFGHTSSGRTAFEPTSETFRLPAHQVFKAIGQNSTGGPRGRRA